MAAKKKAAKTVAKKTRGGRKAAKARTSGH